MARVRHTYVAYRRLKGQVGGGYSFHLCVTSSFNTHHIIIASTYVCNEVQRSGAYTRHQPMCHIIIQHPSHHHLTSITSSYNAHHIIIQHPSLLPPMCATGHKHGTNTHRSAACAHVTPHKSPHRTNFHTAQISTRPIQNFEITLE